MTRLRSGVSGEERRWHAACDTAASEPSSALAQERRLLHAAWDTVASEPSSAFAPEPGWWGDPGEERRSLPPGT